MAHALEASLVTVFPRLKNAFFSHARQFENRVKSHDYIDHCELHFMYMNDVSDDYPDRQGLENFFTNARRTTGVFVLRASQTLSIDRLRGARGFPVAVGTQNVRRECALLAVRRPQRRS